LRNGIRFDLPNGITIFPGGFPLYRNGVLVGAIGISGDGVDQDDIVGASGTHDFLAPNAIRSDQLVFAERACLTQNSRAIRRSEIDVVSSARG